MNKIKSVWRFAVILAAAIPAAAQGQSFSYNFNVPTFNFLFTDSAPGHSLSQIPLTIPGSSITETLEVVGQTVREFGTWNIPAFSLSGSVTENRTVAIFPNPPTVVTGLLSANASSAGLSIPFDTGFRPLTYTGTGALYSVPGFSTFGAIPISATYTLVTGGDTRTETKSGNLFVTLATGESTVDAINFPTSLPLTQSSTGRVSDSLAIAFAPYTAPNGFQSNVKVAPEPSSVALIVAAGGLLLGCRQRKARPLNI